MMLLGEPPMNALRPMSNCTEPVEYMTRYALSRWAYQSTTVDSIRPGRPDELSITADRARSPL